MCGGVQLVVLAPIKKYIYLFVSQEREREREREREQAIRQPLLPFFFISTKKRSFTATHDNGGVPVFFLMIPFSYTCFFSQFFSVSGFVFMMIGCGCAQNDQLHG